MRRVPGTKWSPRIALLTILLSVFPALALADVVSRGGIITYVNSAGNQGTFSVRVTNPYNQNGTATISITLSNNDGSITQSNVTVSISANGTAISSVSQMVKFGSANASATINSGGSTADGQAYSSVNGQPCGSANQPTCPN